MEPSNDLARLRTELANERTLLAWLRSALGLVAAGAAVIRFFPGVGTRVVGLVLIGAGVAALVAGIVRFRSVRVRIGRLAP